MIRCDNILDCCKGLWMPPYGMTGNILLDLSGNDNHAEFAGSTIPTWGLNSLYGDEVQATNVGGQELRLQRTIVTPADQVYSIWIFVNRVSGDSIWGGQDGRGSFLVRIGSEVFSKTTTNLETLSTDVGTGWMSFTAQRDWANNILYAKDAVDFGSETAHTGIINTQSIMNVVGDTMAINGGIIGIAIWHRILTIPDRLELYHNPTIVLEASAELGVLPGGGGGGGAGPSPRANIQGPLVGPLGGPIG